MAARGPLDAVPAVATMATATAVGTATPVASSVANTRLEFDSCCFWF